jgi:hypothetical protein
MKIPFNRCRIVCLLVLLPFLFMFQGSPAQEINKEVFVVRPYEPTLSDATKISVMPVPEEVETPIPSFTYKITPAPIETRFELTPIKPARMVTTALPKIYKSYIKIGLGNYLTPMAEFNISNLHSKEYSLGASLYHKSSYANLTLENQDKVPGGYSITNLNLYGKKFFPFMTLTGNLTLDNDGFNYYGYNVRLPFETPPPMNRDEIHQSVILLGAQAGLHSTYTDSSHLNYNAGISYKYLSDKTNDRENQLLIDASFTKLIETFMGGIDLGIHYFKPDTRMDSTGNSQISISPFISKRSHDWRFLVGFEGLYDKQEVSQFYIHPKGLLEFTVIEKIMIPFIGVGGKLETNNYQKILHDNHFITPGLKVLNTNYKFSAFAGIKGSITPQIAFRADVTYSAVDNMFFFVNDTTAVYPNTNDTIQNTFSVEYDDIDLVQYHGELAFETQANWTVNADFNYYSYSTLKQDKPWHKPQYELNLNAAYLLKEKFLIRGGFVLLGKRYAKTSRTLDPAGFTELKPMLDINLGLTYSYSKVFSVFLDLYNVTNRAHLIWNQYPSQGLNFMIGFSYKL